jgi:membrane protease YdiL (CAAX protease family)
MTLGVFRKVMSTHAAVWVTAAMFGCIRVGQILGIPYLILAGAVFGYARVYGGLPLAMLMHFLHNLVVIAYDAWRP